MEPNKKIVLFYSKSTVVLVSQFSAEKVAGATCSKEGGSMAGCTPSSAEPRSNSDVGRKFSDIGRRLVGEFGKTTLTKGSSCR